MLTTVSLTPDDFQRWAEHLNRQIAESGRMDGHFSHLWKAWISNRTSVVPASRMG